MKKERQPNHKKRNIVLAILLALLCVSAVELAACRYFAPEQYERITAPARQAAGAVASACRYAAAGAAQLWNSAVSQVQASWSQLTAPRTQQEPESQMAGEPTITDGPPITDPTITELVQVEGQEILTGGVVDIVYFYQGGEAWAELPYGSDNIGGYGCGPTAMAMVVSSLTGSAVDPSAMAQWAVEHGYWARKSGSYLSIVEGTARAYGLRAESFDGRTPDELLDELLSGRLLVALMGPGHFTSRGHFILLRGFTLSGEILVADPNSPERSLSVWDPQIILDELSSSTHDGAPLWSVSLLEFSTQDESASP